MPTFYWIGTGLTDSNKNSLDPYDWNYAQNWLVKLVSTSPKITHAATPPGAGDTVYIGVLPDLSYSFGLPAGVSGATMAFSPLLFGGCSGMSPIGGAPGASGPNAIWLNARLSAQSGGTSNSDLIDFFAVLDEHPLYVDPTNPNYRKYHDYPFYSFPFLGGGVGTETLQATENSYYIRDTRGCTAALANAVTQRQRDGLNLRVRNSLEVRTTGKINPQGVTGNVLDFYNWHHVDINLVPSKSSTISSTNTTPCNKLIVYLNGNTLISTPNADNPFVSGPVGANLRGSGDIAIRRYASYTGNDVFAPTVVNRGGVPLIYGAYISNANNQLMFDSMTGSEISDTFALGLSAASSRALNVTINDAMILQCSVFRVPGLVIDGCTMGSLGLVENWPLSEEVPYYDSYSDKVRDSNAIVIASSFDGIQVKNALGFTGASAFAGMNNIGIAPAYGIEGNIRTLKKPRLILGDVSLDDVSVLPDTIKVNNISFNNIGEPPVSRTSTDFVPVPWQLEFIGPASVTSIDAENCNIAADDFFNDYPTLFYRGITGSGISINSLNLGNSATLDMNSVPSFDDWFFGSYITGSTNNGFNGGINLVDPSARIIGSRGIRLYNTKRVGTNYDTRGGTYVP